MLTQAQPGLQAEVQPAANVVAGGAAAPDHFMMAASSAQIARPAGIARLLPMDVALGEPLSLAAAIDAFP